MLGGTFAIQIYQAAAGGPVTPECEAEGIRADLTGALGVCHIVEGIRSRAQTIVWGFGILLGIAAAAAARATYKRMPNKRQREHAVAGGVLGIQAVAVALLLLWFRSGKVGFFARNFLNVEILEGALPGFVRGAKNTIILATVGEFGGILIGLLLAVLAISARRTVRAPATIYVNFFRGTPLIWQLAFFYFFIIFGLDQRIETFTAAGLVFALNTGAYAAEVFRAGIQSIERGQMEAARSLGMTYLQAMRYAVVPQAVRRVIPPLMNEFVILIKDTALVVVLGLTAERYELYTFSREIYSDTGNATAFVATAAGYLVVTLPLIWVVNRVEHRMRSGLTGVVGVGI
ncbi:MAG: amino acid ABC transporter permease [Actinomycetota bacterium]|nr:amino acid ABC transporter permease [Actinomycetota bacterium]